MEALGQASVQFNTLKLKDKSNMDVHAFELQIARIWIWYLGLTLLGFMVSAYVAYLILRAAIRDGIRDSGLVTTWRSKGVQPEFGKDTLPPDMTATR